MTTAYAPTMENTTVSAAAPAQVHSHPSWPVPAANAVPGPAFDPAAAGREVVEKHGEALRRLSA